MVKDSKTGLVWQDNNDTQNITKNWVEAIDYCENLSFGSYDDWRLPNIRELNSIVDYTRSSPSLNPKFKNFIYYNAYYWSSSSLYHTRGGFMWVISFKDGSNVWYNRNSGSTISHVRCVRAGQFFDPLTPPKVNFISESPNDDSVQSATFTKQWQFDRSVDGYSVEVVSSDFSSYGSVSINANTISMSLTPNISKPVNIITLKLKDASGQYVSISGSQTFWATNRTNNAPRLADGQVTQLVSATNEPAFIEIATYDADGDAVTLSVEDDAGGYVGFDPDNASRLFASFSDGKVHHAINVGLDDGKEKVIVTLNVLQFNQTSIESFYSDVDKNANDYIYDGIAFGTLKGVVWGQPDPNDVSKRIFRPTDEASLAEALKIIINAEQKAGLVELKSAQYYRKAYPSWVMPYYTFAVDTGALSKESISLATVYPTRESIAKLIVKTLNLENKVYYIDSNVSFSDEADFTDATMLGYAKIAKAFGLFMTGDTAQPTQHISRADLAMVIERIFMIPSATLSVTPTSVEYGENITAGLSDIQAEAINPTDYTLYDASNQLQITYIANGDVVTNPIDTKNLPSTLRTLYTVLDNHGVKNIVTTAINMHYTDSDKDGLQDYVDQWVNDIRYALDENNNNIPDILDDIYNLSTNTASQTTVLDGYTVSISDIIRDGGWFAPDLDGDGISDHLDPDIDGDGTVNVQDPFPTDASEWLDTDGDGVGNNADTDDDGDGVLDNNDDLSLNPHESVDTDGDGVGNNADRDDDNDGISDVDEIKWAFDPLDASDGGNADADGDGVSNKDEIEAGSNPLDRHDTKKPKRFVPIMMDDLIIMIPQPQ